VFSINQTFPKKTERRNKSLEKEERKRKAPQGKSKIP
jgi:hypothetical protein